MLRKSIFQFPLRLDHINLITSWFVTKKTVHNVLTVALSLIVLLFIGFFKSFPFLTNGHISHPDLLQGFILASWRLFLEGGGGTFVRMSLSFLALNKGLASLPSSVSLYTITYICIILV